MSGSPGDELAWLMDWYASQCDGDWEHAWGIKIETLDNPGWSLEIDLADTDFEDRRFTRLEHGDMESTDSWWICWVESAQFHAVCGPRDLVNVIAVFRRWVA